MKVKRYGKKPNRTLNNALFLGFIDWKYSTKKQCRQYQQAKRRARNWPPVTVTVRTPGELVH